MSLRASLFLTRVLPLLLSLVFPAGDSICKATS
jgi:hypothetical protein